jgi:hypothetical protein
MSTRSKHVKIIQNIACVLLQSIDVFWLFDLFPKSKLRTRPRV